MLADLRASSMLEQRSWACHYLKEPSSASNDLPIRLYLSQSGQ